MLVDNVIKKEKRTFSVEGEIKPIEVRGGLWEEFDQAIRSDPKERFSNKSEAIRYFMVSFIEEVSKLRG